MLKFFRSLRKNLISESKTTKYFKYAIGEILLVVIGILLALQINNWNQNRQDRLQEQEILGQLLNEYDNNLNQLHQKMEIRNVVVKSSLKLLNYRNTDKQSIDADSFNLHVSRFITRPTFDPELGVTNELTSSGKLYLITNPQLRNYITSFPSLLSELTEEERVAFNNVEDRILPYLSEHYQVGKILAEFLNDEAFRAKFTLVQSKNNVSFKDLFTQVDFMPLLMHPIFEDHLAIMISNTIYTNEQSEGVKDKIEAIISLINQEIDKK